MEKEMMVSTKMEMKTKIILTMVMMIMTLIMKTVRVILMMLMAMILNHIFNKKIDVDRCKRDLISFLYFLSFFSSYFQEANTLTTLNTNLCNIAQTPTSPTLEQNSSSPTCLRVYVWLASYSVENKLAGFSRACQKILHK